MVYKQQDCNIEQEHSHRIIEQAQDKNGVYPICCTPQKQQHVGRVGTLYLVELKINQQDNSQVCQVETSKDPLG